MKTKIVYEEFNKENGISIVTIQNKYGRFTGMAMCHPDDSFSPFQGERIAATKANIEFLKFRIKQTKAEAKGINKLLSDFYYNTDISASTYVGPVWKHALVKLKRYEKDIENFKEGIEILKNSIVKMDNERQEVLKRSKQNK